MRQHSAIACGSLIQNQNGTRNLMDVHTARAFRHVPTLCSTSLLFEIELDDEQDGRELSCHVSLVGPDGEEIFRNGEGSFVAARVDLDLPPRWEAGFSAMHHSYPVYGPYEWVLFVDGQRAAERSVYVYPSD